MIKIRKLNGLKPVQSPHMADMRETVHVDAGVLQDLKSLEIELSTGARFSIDITSFQQSNDALRVVMSHPGYVVVPTVSPSADRLALVLKPVILG